MAVTIQTRRDDAVDWATANPVLALGEIGIETDTDKAKYGDGFTAWNDLDYWIDAGSQIDPGTADGNTLRWEADQSSWVESSALVVADSGNVGIGTTAPNRALEIEGGAGAYIRLNRTNSSDGYCEISGTGADGGRLTLSANPAGSGVGEIRLETQGSERMRITDAGNVGIGTATPAKALDVNGSIATSGGSFDNRGILLSHQNNTNTSYIGAYSDFNTSANGTRIQFRYDDDVTPADPSSMGFNVGASEAMRIDSDQIVLINRSSPIAGTTTGKLHVGGVNAVAARFYRNSASSAINVYYGAGEVVAYQINADGTAGPSDARYKENIKDSTLGLDEVMALKVREFDWLAPREGHIKAGFIAQELQEVLPDAVPEMEDGSLGRSDAHILPVLVKAIQELTSRVEALENG